MYDFICVEVYCQSFWATGVYAKKLLSKRLQFGPLQAEKVLAGSQQVATEEEINERLVFGQ